MGNRQSTGALTGDEQYLPLSGPAGHFLFGSAREFHAQRLGFLEGMTTTYGDAVRYRLGCDWYNLINAPAAARDLLCDWHGIDNATTDGAFQLNQSFIAMNGRARALPRSIVHSTMCPRAATASQSCMALAVEQMLTGWRDGESRDVLADMMRLNVEITSQSLFGCSADRWLTPLLPVLTDLQMLVGAYTRSAETLERMHIDRRFEVFVQVEQLVERFVMARPDGGEAPALRIFRRAQAKGRLSERAIIHELSAMLLSVSSTAITSLWIWYCLARHPDARTRLEAELDALPPGRPTMEALKPLTYLNLFLQEVLRLFPALALLHRKVESDWCGPGWRLSAGEYLHISPYLLHRHPFYWQRPEAFLPERFDPESPAHHPEQHVAYMPFGVGVRRCIGDVQALQQLQITTAMVARDYRLEIAADYNPRYDVSPLGVLHPEVFSLRAIARRRTLSRSTATLEAGA